MYVIIMIDPEDLGFISLAMEEETAYTLTFKSRNEAIAWIKEEKESAGSWPCHQIIKLRGIKCKNT